MKQSRSLKVSLCKGCMKKVIFPIVLAQSPLGIVLWNHMTIKQRHFLSLYKRGTKNKVSFPIRIEPLTFRLTWHFRALFDWMLKNQDQSIHSDQSEERKIPWTANEKSKWKEANQLKHGKTRVTKLWLVWVLHQLAWEDGVSFLNQSQSKVK